jgi:wyosine [tRNA(Phe)-imidazoG37] synthetase (radical SAM superfamily)
MEGTAMIHYVFGPVSSRRLGRSLGVDLVPFKTCTYDCIYCQLGQTTCKTVERKEWVPLEQVLDQLKEKLATRPDYITLSGSGEPTLFTPLDRMIDGIRAMTDLPIAVLTNGSLLGNSAVQRELRQADLVIPSLDAGNENTFRLVNRPHEGLSFEHMLAGLVAFRRRFRGQYWLEVLLVDPYTTSDWELADIRRCVELIQPDRVHLNTVIRPPAEDYARPVSAARLAEIASAFRPPAEVIAEHQAGGEERLPSCGREEILDLLRRRPCTSADIAAGLGMHPAEVVKLIESLCLERLVDACPASGKLHYRAAPGIG